MILDKTKILGLVKFSVALRNTLQEAVAKNDHIITVAAQAKTETTPAQAEYEKATGQLVTAAGAAHNLATQLVHHLEHIAPEAVKDGRAILADMDNKLSVHDDSGEERKGIEIPMDGVLREAALGEQKDTAATPSATEAVAQ